MSPERDNTENTTIAANWQLPPSNPDRHAADLQDAISPKSENADRSASQPEHGDNEKVEGTDPGKAVYTVFSPSMRRFVVIMAAWASFFSPLSGNIYYPALNSLADEFNTSSSNMNLTLTTYMILQGLAPSIFGDLADMCGRRPAYLLGFTLYIAADVGIALVPSFGGLLALRCLQSAGSSGTIAMASGVAADVSTSAERGKYMGWVLSGAMIGPAIGPILGGIISEFAGWRWIFWFLAILAGCFLIPFLIAFPETGRNVVGNGSIPPQPWNRSIMGFLAAKKKHRVSTANSDAPTEQADTEAREALAEKRPLRIPNPLNALRIICQPDAAALLAFNSVNFAAFYDISASLPYLFKQIYGFNELEVGLCFIPFGFGCFMAPLFNGPLLDWRFRVIARRAGIAIDTKSGNKIDDFPIERARVPVAWPMSTLAAVAVICYGWTMEREAHLAAPLVLLFIMGAAFVASANVCSTLIVDYNPGSPSTATAANNLCRCLFSAGATAVIIDMIHAMGRGWCFTFIGLVIMAASPLLLVLLKWGPGWRRRRQERQMAGEIGNKT